MRKQYEDIEFADVTSEFLRTSGTIKDAYRHSGEIREPYENSGQYYPDVDERLQVKQAQENYAGADGYNRMLSEIRTSLYSEIPEARGSIEIFDHLADRDEEINRIASSLNMTVERLHTSLGYDDYEEFKDIMQGKMIHTHLDDGRYIAIATAWDPDMHGQDTESMTYDDIKIHARIIAHETLHALDPRIQEGQSAFYGSEGWVITQFANARSAEMFADVGAQDLMLRNGDTTESTQSLIVSYDTDASYRDIPRYDNGPFLQKLLDDYPSNHGLHNFKFEGWRETIDKISDMRESGEPEISIDWATRIYPQTIVLQNVKDRVLENLENKLEPVKQDLMEQHSIDDFRGYLESWFNDMDFKGWRDGKYDGRFSEEQNALLEGVYIAKNQMADWLEDNKECFPDAGRAAVAIRHLLGQSDDYISHAAPNPSELTTDMLMARNWQRLQDTGDDIYATAVHLYGNMSRLTEQHGHKEHGKSEDFETYSRRQIADQLFTDHPKLVDAVANGIPLTDLVVKNDGDPDTVMDDRYQLAPDFDDIIEQNNTSQIPNDINSEQTAPSPALHINP